MRPEEQYSLRWVNVDLKRGQITLPSTKSGERQHIPINSEARKALARLRAIAPGSELVCPGEKEHRKWWDAARAEAKIAHYRWHDNRHTFASRLVQAGVPILTVNKLMRHATLQMTMRYAHLAPKNLHDAVEVLARSVTRGDTAPSQPIAAESSIVH